MLADMKKVMVIGHRSTRHELLRALHKSGLVEIIKTRPIDETIRLDNTDKATVYQEKINRLLFCFKFLKECHTQAVRLVKETKKTDTPYEYKQVKEPMFSNIKILSYDEFMDISTKEVEILAQVADLEEVSQEIIALNAERTKVLTESKALEIYTSLPNSFNYYKDTKKAVVYLGTIATKNVVALEEFVKEKPEYIFQAYEGDEKLTPIVMIAIKDESEDMLLKLHELESERCVLDSDFTAKELIENNNKKIEELDEKKLALLTRALEKERFIRDFKTLSDYYSIEIQKLEALDSFAATDRSFVLEGWYPANKEKELKERLDAVDETLIYEFSEQQEGEIQPTYQKPNRILDGFRGVTNMYAPPLKGTDIDPTIFVAFFYFILFGLMLADAAYGLILTIGGLILYRLMKPAPGKGNLVLLIALCGVSTFIWGVLFGSWFSITLPEDSFLLKLRWFSPMDDALKMLILSYVVGFVHICTGMAINAAQLIKTKQIRQAFGSVFGWFFIFIALILLTFNMIVSGINMMFNTSLAVSVPGWLKYVGFGFAGLGVLCIIFLSNNKKNPLKRVFGGVAKLYDGVNILSDILSYSRLFGLGLAGAVVGMVVNQVAMVFFDLIPYVGYVIGAVILLIGHVFNIAINTLGAYIHDCRLQYIEFFGKFYTGGGHVFRPYGSKTKYTYIDMTK